MLVPCPGRRSRATGRRGAPAPHGWAGLAALGLAGCTDAPAGAGAWGFVAFSLLLAAAAGYAIGTLRTRAEADRTLRQARAETQQLSALQVDWLWQTDADHRAVHWQGPGRAPGSDCTLLQDPALIDRLRARQPFSDLRLQARQPLDGSHAWVLRGVPRQDDLGRFAGFAGAASPCDGADALQADAAALRPALQAHGGPALLLAEGTTGWQVQQFNTAASALWPGLVEGASLADAPAELPATLVAALGQEAAAEIDGWLLRPLAARPGAVRAAVVARQGAGTDASQAAQSAESDNFSFTVSHDLRAPIRVVEGFTRIVKEDYGRLLDRVGNDHLDRVLGAAARMNLMIDALLTLARLSSQPLARQPVNLSQLASYVIDDLRRAAPEREAEIEIEPELLTQGDPTLLRLVLENLLGNAWKYSARCPKAHITLASTRHGSRTAYVVRDNGAGFDMRSSERLFGLFQRLHSASEFPGHGVGLASVRRIVRRHGGDIWAEAEPGRGAAFYFTLAG